MVIDWFAVQHPHLSPLLFHIPNGGWRHKWEAAKLKRMGVRAGIPDLFLAVPRRTVNSVEHGLFLELKTERGKLSAVQKYYLSALEAEGYRAVCCHGFEEAITVINDYLESKRPKVKKMEYEL